MPTGRLRIDIEWSQLLPVTEGTFFGGEQFTFEGVPVRSVDVPRAGNEKLVVSFQTDTDTFTAATLASFVSGVRAHITDEQETDQPVSPPEPDRVLVSSHQLGGRNLPRVFRVLKPVLHVVVPEAVMIDDAMYEDALRSELDYMVDVATTPHGYQVVGTSDSIPFDTATTVTEVTQTELGVPPTIVFYADQSDPAPEDLQ